MRSRNKQTYNQNQTQNLDLFSAEQISSRDTLFNQDRNDNKIVLKSVLKLKKQMTIKEILE